MREPTDHSTPMTPMPAIYRVAVTTGTVAGVITIVATARHHSGVAGLAGIVLSAAAVAIGWLLITNHDGTATHVATRQMEALDRPIASLAGWTRGARTLGALTIAAGVAVLAVVLIALV